MLARQTNACKMSTWFSRGFDLVGSTLHLQFCIPISSHLFPLTGFLEHPATQRPIPSLAASLSNSETPPIGR